MCKSDEMRSDCQISDGALSKGILPLEEQINDVTTESEALEKAREEIANCIEQQEINIEMKD